MNEQILKWIAAFPRGGGYRWDPTQPTSGVTREITYKGKTILERDTATYCCGVTFQGWFETIGYNVELAISEMQKVQQLFYCAKGNRGGCQDALTAVRLGVIVTLDQAKPGDLLQLWRKPTANNPKGSGHSVFYLRHNAETLTYFSTQRRTNGPGEGTERLDNMADLFFVRPIQQEVNFKP